MSLNRKLTPLIAGRTIQTCEEKDGALEIGFGDGSRMRIKVSGTGQVFEPRARAVRLVRQKGTLMQLDFTDDTTAEIQLAEAMSSVMLRDKQGVIEYAD